MKAKVLIPTALRAYAGNQESVELDGNTVGEVLEQLTQTHADLRRHLYDADGRLRNFVNIYVGDEDVRHLNNMDTPLAGGEVLSIIPSIAGGAPSNVPPATVESIR
jgi:adenylyltransferase/sulfurtransferase